ncbi:MAG TPA: biotin--[acetyl-CoA-carboxylase] ligase [Rhodospirillales bacterium]|jgi:BirA family biotin operon repressor/biotin-[acetyl-CoA-carboxylase] ligase|nr:biotin--[acetyl-CoA-carboxylase] ligase [Rhodospirillales bacterium]
MGESLHLPGPFRQLLYDSIDSTNEEAKRLGAVASANKGPSSRQGEAGEITVIRAKEQTAGKGRRGRSWVSKPGNLYCSLLLRPGVPAATAMQLGFVTANSVAESVAAVLPSGTFVTCKWPNDVLVEGRKVAGILLESSAADDVNVDWLVIGVGINIRHHPSRTRFPATSLTSEGAGKVTVASLLESFCLRFLAGFVTWRNLGFAPIRGAWLQRAESLGGQLKVRLERETLHGIFKGVDADGALILNQDGRERRITVGDVFPTEPPSPPAKPR